MKTKVFPLGAALAESREPGRIDRDPVGTRLDRGDSIDDIFDLRAVNDLPSLANPSAMFNRAFESDAAAAQIGTFAPDELALLRETRSAELKVLGEAGHGDPPALVFRGLDVTVSQIVRDVNDVEADQGVRYSGMIRDAKGKAIGVAFSAVKTGVGR